jgi:CRP-like cAMP-binding protein
VKEGQVPEEAYTIIFGWVARAKILPDGRRQILHFFLPGDVLAYDNLLNEPIRYSLQTLTQVGVCAYSRREFYDRLMRYPATMTAAAMSCLGRLADAEEHLVRLGRRSASERLANLVLHLHDRLVKRHLIPEKAFQLPLRLDDFADALGLTPVHVSRTLAALREQKLFAFHGGRAEILNRKAMETLAGF